MNAPKGIEEEMEVQPEGQGAQGESQEVTTIPGTTTDTTAGRDDDAT